MTWNGPHESISIKWSTKALPWKESPSRNEPAPNLYPGHYEEPEHWVGSADSCQCRENLIPLCTSLLRSTSTTDLPASLLLPSHFTASPSKTFASSLLMTLGGTAVCGTSSQPMRMHPDTERQRATSPHLQILFVLLWAHINCWPFPCRCLLWCLWSCRSRSTGWALGRLQLSSSKPPPAQPKTSLLVLQTSSFPGRKDIRKSPWRQTGSWKTMLFSLLLPHLLSSPDLPLRHKLSFEWGEEKTPLSLELPGESLLAEANRAHSSQGFLSPLLSGMKRLESAFSFL